MERIETHRKFYAELVTGNAGVPRGDGRLVAAFATVPREDFVGAGPWKIFTAVGYIETPTDDAAFLYQDVVVAIAPERKINNGQPILHALSLAALGVKEGEKAVHIGSGTGYYTAILARLVGPSGSVVGYELERDLAARATLNLADETHARVEARSGAEGELPKCDAIYVSAGATAPMNAWLNALRVGGRLLFPLTPSEGPSGTPGAGGMLLVTRSAEEKFGARFLCPAAFVGCAGARDDETAAKLSEAFRKGNWREVKSLRRGTEPDETCWVAGQGWWLSTKEE